MCTRLSTLKRRPARAIGRGRILCEAPRPLPVPCRPECTKYSFGGSGAPDRPGKTFSRIPRGRNLSKALTLTVNERRSFTPVPRGKHFREPLEADACLRRAHRRCSVHAGGCEGPRSPGHQRHACLDSSALATHSAKCCDGRVVKSGDKTTKTG